ncbi:hypothetical protein [Alkaliphilus serpentinus]|uniref:Uncharacterized protein n=1 Tax=Alkaliphilus serpentinus TaxID=1482731 RepID=A0A833M8L6_9FIRM|nr:hypothetical protein [Alkaliphilus serpentinus]KAB3524796.1 hypothetical protein F8153_15785 [Alkaliphilus serpentinus]
MKRYFNYLLVVIIIILMGLIYVNTPYKKFGINYASSMYNQMMSSLLQNKTILDEITSSDTIKIGNIVELHANYLNVYSNLAEMERFSEYVNYEIRNKRPIIQIVSDFYRFTGDLIQNDASFDIYHIQLEDHIYTLSKEDAVVFSMMREITNTLINTIMINMPSNYQLSYENHIVRNLDFKIWLECYNDSNRQIEEFIMEKYKLSTVSNGVIGDDLINRVKNK